MSIVVLVAAAGCTLTSEGPPATQADTPPVLETGSPTIGAADLIIASVVLADGESPRCGEETTVDFTIENRGTGASVETSVWFEAESNGLPTDAVAAPIPAIDAGGQYSGSASFVIPSPPNAVHTMTVTADPELINAELNEENNTFELSYTAVDSGNCVPIPLP